MVFADFELGQPSHFLWIDRRANGRHGNSADPLVHLPEASSEIVIHVNCEIDLFKPIDFAEMCAIFAVQLQGVPSRRRYVPMKIAAGSATMPALFGE